MTRPRLYCWVHSTTGISQGGGTKGGGAIRCRAGSASGVHWKRLKQPHFAKPIHLRRFLERPGLFGLHVASASHGKVLPARGWAPMGLEGAARGEGGQWMQYRQRHLLPSAKFCPPVRFRLKTRSSRWGSQPKASGSSLKAGLFGRKQIPLCKISFQNSICSKILPVKAFRAAVPQQRDAAWAGTLLRVGDSTRGRSRVLPAAAEGRSWMQTLNPGLSTQPKITLEGGDFLSQARSGALGEPPPLAAPQGCPNQAGTGGKAESCWQHLKLWPRLQPVPSKPPIYCTDDLLPQSKNSCRKDTYLKRVLG